MINSVQCALHIWYSERHVKWFVNTALLPLKTDKHLEWKNHMKHMMQPQWCLILAIMTHTSIFVQFNLLWYIILNLAYTLPSTMTNFISHVNTCYMFRFYWPSSGIKYMILKLKTNAHTGCFTTLGHNCRRWFHRFLWSKKFI